MEQATELRTLILYSDERKRYELDWEMIARFAWEANRWIDDYRHNPAFAVFGSGECADAETPAAIAGKLVEFPQARREPELGEETGINALLAKREQLVEQLRNIDDFLELRAASI